MPFISSLCFLQAISAFDRKCCLLMVKWECDQFSVSFFIFCFFFLQTFEAPKQGIILCPLQSLQENFQFVLFFVVFRLWIQLSNRHQAVCYGSKSTRSTVGISGTACSNINSNSNVTATATATALLNTLTLAHPVKCSISQRQDQALIQSHFFIKLDPFCMHFSLSPTLELSESLTQFHSLLS